MKFWNHRKKAFPLVLVLGCIYLHVWRLLLGLVCLLICLLPLEALIKPFDNNDRGVTFVMWYSHQEVIREVERIPSTLSSLTNQPQPEQGPGWDNGEIGGTTVLGRCVWQKLVEIFNLNAVFHMMNLESPKLHLQRIRIWTILSLTSTVFQKCAEAGCTY